MDFEILKVRNKDYINVSIKKDDFCGNLAANFKDICGKREFFLFAINYFI